MVFALACHSRKKRVRFLQLFTLAKQKHTPGTTLPKLSNIIRYYETPHTLKASPLLCCLVILIMLNSRTRTARLFKWLLFFWSVPSVACLVNRDVGRRTLRFFACIVTPLTLRSSQPVDGVFSSLTALYRFCDETFRLTWKKLLSSGVVRF